MMRKILTNILFFFASTLVLTGCEGGFGWVYDDVGDMPFPPSPEDPSVTGVFYLDASSWSSWHYIDLEKLAETEGDEERDASDAIVEMEIPRSLTGERPQAPKGEEPGIYTYWFDVLGPGGLDVNEKRSFEETDAQPEPEKWTIAIHREVVRTNGCAVLKTNYTSFDDLPQQSSWFTGSEFKEDEWSEKDVWVVQDWMLMGLIGSQGIRINKVLSDWCQCHLPPVPPTYSMLNNIFIVRLPNGKYAALQMQNIYSPKGKSCHFTIKYRYPY